MLGERLCSVPLGLGAALPTRCCRLTEGLGGLSWRNRFRQSYKNADLSHAPGLHITFVTEGPFSFAQEKKEKEEREKVNRLDGQRTSFLLLLEKGGVGGVGVAISFY